MKNRIRLTGEDRAVNAVVMIISVLLLIMTLYPFYMVLVYSFNEGADTARGGFMLFPRKPTLLNYSIVMRDKTLVTGFVMTVLRTLVGTASSVVFTSMVAYALSKEDLVFRKGYSVFMIITMYFGGGLIPSFLLLKSLGLLNNFMVYIIPGLFGYYNALLFMAFFRELPAELEESAYIDGAGHFRVFRSIVFPLSKPVLATIALFVGVGHWQDWFTSVYFISDTRLWTMPAILMRVLSGVEGLKKIKSMQAMQSVMGADPNALGAAKRITLESVKYATLVVTIFPITISYPFLQKYFVKGMLVGSIKA